MNKNASLLLALCGLMAVLAVMFVYISSQNTTLKNRVSKLQNELVEEQMKRSSGAAQELSDEPAVSEAAAPETSEAPVPEADTGRFEEFTDENGNVVPAVVIYDDGTDRWDFPVIEGAERFKYDFSELSVHTDENLHRVVYDKDGKKISKFGIDVARHQGVIDWQAVAEDGVEFAFIRAGARGYETGAFLDDLYFEDNFRGAKEAGLDVGVYFFSQALDAEEGREEAEYVIEKLRAGGFEPDLPVVFDWERITSGEYARTDEIEDGELNSACTAFCEAVSEAGYQPAFYTNIRTAFFDYDVSELPYTKWVANYGKTNPYIYDYSFWQYSESGVINGIDAFVDLDIWFTEEE